MKTGDIIRALRRCADYVPGKSKCNDSCPVFADTVSIDRPWCCFNMFREAADRLEELDERVAIMSETRSETT